MLVYVRKKLCYKIASPKGTQYNTRPDFVAVVLL